MKTEKQVALAIDRMTDVSMQPGINLGQYSVLAAMVTALSWVVEDPDMPAREDGMNVVDRLLASGRVWTPEEN